MILCRAAARLVRHVPRGLCQVTLSLLRAIPEVSWVLVFILAVGLGFAGTLVLGVHTGGVLGSLRRYASGSIAAPAARPPRHRAPVRGTGGPRRTAC